MRHKKEGDEVYWLIFTALHEGLGVSRESVKKRHAEIEKVGQLYGFKKTYKLDFPAAQIDQTPFQELASRVSPVVNEVQPDCLYLPFRGDIHSDHKVVFDLMSAYTKWFRYKSIKRVLSYEVPSETEFGIGPQAPAFHPNVFIDITHYLDQKIDIMKIYATEMGVFPFPRSEQALRALSHYRGAASGFEAAEAFMLLKEQF